MKGSIQLSVNFMVVMILTLTIIGLGFVIFGKIFAGIVELPDSIDDSSQRQLDILLQDTDYALSKNFVTVERGQAEVVWLGIVNSYDHPVCYTINVDRWEGESGARPSGLTEYFEEAKAEPNKQISSAILLKPKKDTPKDQYSVNIFINLARCDGTAVNGTASFSRKLFVRVV